MLTSASVQSLCRKLNFVCTLWLGFALLVSTIYGQSFVQRSGTHLVLDGEVFRFSGPNIEWLGLEGYGPHDPIGPRYPSRFEVDDVFATAAEMGARVVRSQTMGDTIGCPRCIEPQEGQFNQEAFQASDYALTVAAKYHMKVIISLIGDCATCAGGGIGQYLAWHKRTSFQDFFTDPALIAAYERHVDAVLNHRNAITGLLYRDDPTILAWENCNMCGIFSVFMHGNIADVVKWSEAVGEHIKSIDHHHLYLDTTGVFRNAPEILSNASVDAFAFEEYPHWDALLGVTAQHTGAETIAHDAAMVVKGGKVFILNEFGWDKTDWATSEDLQHVLDSFVKNPDISGDGFWALQGHSDNFGFQLTPADTTDPVFAAKGESGEWWALYYPGRRTLVMTAEDMAGRAQQLRTHAYQMAGLPVPEHAVPPPPWISSVVIGGLVAWRGSAGATRYSIESMAPGSSAWKLICDRCATDEQDPWIDPHGVLGSRYRVTAYNADNVASRPSEPK